MFNPDSFVDIINQSLPEPHASLLAGMIFGQQYSRLPEQFYQALVRTGTLHVVALSGTNVTILVRLVGKSCRYWGRKLAAILTLGTILGFVLFVGAAPPIVRAAIMGAIAVVGDFASKRHYGLLSLLFAGGIMLLLWPEWLDSLSFQLSFLATLGIIIFDARQGTIESRPVPAQFSLPLQKERARFSIAARDAMLELAAKARVTFVENLRTTLAAQVLITPLLVYNFGRWSLVAPLANALALWSVEVITPLGIFLALAGAVWAPAGRLIGWGCWFFLQYFILIVELTSKIPFGEITF